MKQTTPLTFGRRRFLRTVAATVASSALQPLSRRFAHAAVAAPTDGVSATFEAVVKGAPRGLAVFTDEANEPLGVATGEGLDGRLFTDLRWLSPGSMITPIESFFIRTRTPDQLDRSKPWSVRIGGHVEKESGFSVDELRALGVRAAGAHVLECSGNGRILHFGMLSCGTFDGVPLPEILKRSRPTSKATRVLISGFDEHSKASANSTAGASWVFRPEDLERSILAVNMNGKPLTSDHGAPVRLLTPGWYGCTDIKWVNEIRWVDDTQLSTSQMQEFADRTHQQGSPFLAKDFQPAIMDQAAMPVRVEKWALEGKVIYRIVGVTWGGPKRSRGLVIRCVPKLPSDEKFSPVTEVSEADGRPWNLWSALWQPKKTGDHAIQLMVNDSTVRTRRLGVGFYTRTINVDEL